MRDFLSHMCQYQFYIGIFLDEKKNLIYVIDSRILDFYDFYIKKLEKKIACIYFFLE